MAIQLPRRSFLRGVGAALALPSLEAMLPKIAFGGEAAVASPTRMAYVFFPNGAIMNHWTPTEVGTNFQLPKTLQPLAPVKDSLTIITGLAHDKARPHGDGGGDHARSAGAFLTGAQPRKTGGADIHLGMSVDQVAAAQIGQATKLPSLELGTEEGKQAGNCDSGYSCAYTSNISWKSPTTPMAKEINPKQVFERLFGDGSDAEARKKRNFYRKSILDFISNDAEKLKEKLGQTDRRKVDEYFVSVREIEQRIERAAVESKRREPAMQSPKGVPPEYTEYVKLMYDLMVVAFQSDSTRIATFMLANEGSNRSYREVDVKEGHHELSHHRNEEAKMAQLQKIDQFQVEQFAYFVKRLQETKEGDGNLLDRSMIVYGCALSDSNRHNHDNLPVVLAGRGNGKLPVAQHIKLEKETPMNNLFLSLLDRVDVHVDSFGDSTGRLSELG